MDIGQHVELVNEVKNMPAGTKGIIKSTEPLTMQLYPLQNNVVLEVQESDLKLTEETQTNGTSQQPPKKVSKRRKTT